jgi:hypothetical protein
VSRVASHQPAVLPWAGYWVKVRDVDHFVVSAGVDFNKSNYQHRVKLHDSWWGFRLCRDSTKKDIASVQVLEDSVAEFFSRGVRELSVKRYPYRSEVTELLLEMSTRCEGLTSLTDLTVLMNNTVQEYLGIPTEIHVQTTSPQQTDKGMSKSDRLENRMNRIVEDMGEYYAGGGARAYLQDFKRSDVYVQRIDAPNRTIMEDIALYGAKCLEVIDYEWEAYSGVSTTHR